MSGQKLCTMSLEKVAKLCKVQPDTIMSRLRYEYLDISWDHLDICMKYLFKNSFDEFCKISYYEDPVINYNLISYFDNRDYDISSLAKIDVDLYDFDENETNYFVDLLGNRQIYNVTPLYYKAFYHAIYKNYSSIVLKIIDIVGIDELCNYAKYPTNFYKVAIDYNMSLKSVWDSVRDISGHIWLDTSLHIIYSIADTYGYEYGLKILLSYNKRFYS